MFLLITAIVSIVLWSAVTHELGKPSEQKNKEHGFKIITLMSAGTLSTIIVTFSLFQNFQL
ncbi:hypothetical protein [Halobacillus sp. B23F22_1]|uniref:hypothetical protein n=1 Tax=Halobacillus sp. B23F22_1 TaxID=3459514 RepID=UPI00373EE70D